MLCSNREDMRGKVVKRVKDSKSEDAHTLLLLCESIETQILTKRKSLHDGSRDIVIKYIFRKGSEFYVWGESHGKDFEFSSNDVSDDVSL